jgi:phage host-nuclease inhibitor protein Gam
MMEQSQPTLQEFLDDQEQVNAESFVIDTEEKANWALRKIRSLKEKKQDNIALAEAEISKIDAWLESVNEKVDRDAEYFQNMLAAYAQKRRNEDSKFKSLKLPHGKIAFRKQQPKWEYDDSKLLESLKSSGLDDLIRIKEEPDKTAIKKRLVVSGEFAVNPDSGELIGGITIQQREDDFKVEV